MTETIGDRIAKLRVKREANSKIAEGLRFENRALSDEIRALEKAITPPKRQPAPAKADDPVTIVMKAEPATIGIAPIKIGR